MGLRLEANVVYKSHREYYRGYRKAKRFDEASPTAFSTHFNAHSRHFNAD